MISVASASFSSRTTASRSAWYPGVIAPCAMCSRARRRSVSMSERNAPFPECTALIALLPRLAGRGRARGARDAACATGRAALFLLLALDAGERLVALRFRFVHAGGLLLAFLVVAALLGDVV